MSITVEEAQQAARKLSESRAENIYGPGITITDWAPVSDEHHWQDGTFNWEMNMRHPFGPHSLEVAIWENRNLIALGVATPMTNRLLLRFVEGNPDIQSKLKGQRLFLVLDVAANYAEMLGKTEVRLKPQSEAVLNFCVAKLGLEALEDGHCRLMLSGETS